MYDQLGTFETSYGGFLVQFKPDQELLHATWFGGDAGTQTTGVRALVTNPDGVFATGLTTKATNPSAYFPLDNGQGLAWFDGEFNHLGQSVLGTDAFVTLFCQEFGVGLNNVSAAAVSQQPNVSVLSADRIVVHGLPDGQRSYYVTNTDGRILNHGRLTSFGGHSSSITTGGLPTGIYMLKCTNTPAARFIIH